MNMPTLKHLVLAALVTAAAAGCSHKHADTTPTTTSADPSGAMGGATYGGATYGGSSYGATLSTP